MTKKRDTATHESNVVSLDDHRPHNASYCACIECAHDWPCIHPPEVVEFECPKCRAMAGEIVAPGDIDFFERFMGAATNKKSTRRRTLILLNAQRMIDDGTFD